jgi:hypothetical protein
MDYSPKIFGVPIEVAFACFALLAAVNLVFLDIFLITSPKKTESAASVIVQSNQSAQAGESCPGACLTKIRELVATSAASITAISTSMTPAPTPKPAKAATNPVTEFFIPFGSGSGESTDWQDVPGLLAAIDTANYATNRTVTFEASLRIPTGNQIVYARLFNVTDKHPVWFSDVSVEGGIANLVVSPAITLDAGNKTYQVQLKTSLGFLSYVDQARLRIVTR